jgi:glycosyltransferase involved in cell wall biosynthesis
LNTNLRAELDYAAILTTFNAEATIADSLNSILAQSQEPNEIIIVDDCSTDGTVKILKSYEKLYPKMILVINESNSGQSYSRNIAAEISKSTFLVFFDDDDVSLKNRASNHLRMHGLGYAVTFVSSRKLYGNGYTVRCQNDDFSIEILDGSFMIRKLILGNSSKDDPTIWIPASTCSIKREVFLQIGGFDLEMRRLEDADIAIRAGIHGIGAAWSSEILVERKATFSKDKGGEIEGQYERRLVKKYSSMIAESDTNLSILLIDFREAYFSKDIPRFLNLVFRNLPKLAFLMKKFSPFIRRMIHDGKRGGV